MTCAFYENGSNGSAALEAVATEASAKLAKEASDKAYIKANLDESLSGLDKFERRDVLTVTTTTIDSAKAASPTLDGLWADADVYKRQLQGCGVKLNIVQNGRKLTKSQAKSILSGGTVHLTGLSKKDGSGTFDTDAKLGAAPYTGFVEFCRSEKPGGSAGRTGSRRRGGKR